ncbi:MULTISPECIES: thioesterase II family protein [unclassified Streptomyces]|uniref:thioesterase II family protein n=1 Tax=unclassified Streptomyces TaxID=2593676 RepID=UPI00278C2936|nr:MULTISPECIES: thioesterase domain-containing protein [unclassified Streptomyces]
MPHEQPVRLYCFAHAGADVSTFQDWTAAVGPGVIPVPVLLPGRGRRRDEFSVTTREALLGDVLHLFTNASAGPCVLYGHGLGALVCYTVARALLEIGLPGPALLAVGACTPPHMPPESAYILGVPEAELLRTLDRMGVVPPGTDLGGIREPAGKQVLRDDLALDRALRAAARTPSPADPLSTPLLIIAGDDDGPASPALAEGWHAWTEGPVRLRTVSDGHLFVRGSQLPRLMGQACRVVRRLDTTRRQLSMPSPVEPHQ